MKTLKYICLTALLFAVALPVMAQRRFDPARMVKMQTQEIFTNIKTLNQQQKDQIQKIFTQHADSIQTIFNNDSLDRQERFQQMRQLRTTLDAQLKGVFTKEQYKQYEDLMAKMRDRRRRMRNN